jgi:hypothetical protein
MVEMDMEADPDRHISKDVGSNDGGEHHANPMGLEAE